MFLEGEPHEAGLGVGGVDQVLLAGVQDHVGTAHAPTQLLQLPFVELVEVGELFEHLEMTTDRETAW